jgi:hypothetical protein
MCEMYLLRKAVLGMALVSCVACATTQGLPGESIEASTGKRTGNPFEIRLTAKGSELKAVLIVGRRTADKWVLHEAYLQPSTLEVVSATGSQRKPYDSRMIKKYDTTPYCRLFRKLDPGTKLELGSARFQKSRDGYTGQWGPFHFDELPADEYLVRVIWHSEHTQCLDESTRQMRKLPSVWRGIVKSNQVPLRLR